MPILRAVPTALDGSCKAGQAGWQPAAAWQAAPHGLLSSEKRHAFVPD